MYIVWGTKLVRSKLGRRADFCPLCRDVAATRVIRVATVPHVNYIPMGRKKDVGIEETCEGCGLMRSTETGPDGPRPEVSRDRHADLESLIFATYPDVRADNAERLAYEARLRDGRLEPGERKSALLESFTLAGHRFEAEASRSHIDGASVLLAAVAVITGLVGVISHAENQPGAGVWVPVFLTIAAVTFVASMGRIMTTPRRRARKVVLPVLARAIRPLAPTPEDVGEALEAIKARGLKLGKVATAEDVEHALLVGGVG